MSKLPAILLAGVVSLPFAAQAQFTGKVSLYSEYEYRGITQTSEKPALQLNLDYAHSSGFYAGFFATNIKWLKDYKDIGAAEKEADVELDFFGGYKFEVVKDVTLDVGYLRYEYPGHKGNPKANTDEIYLGASYGPVSAKYSYSLGDTFAVPTEKGSSFVELNIAYPLMDKVTLTGHVGHQKFKGFDALDYTVYKLGFNYDFGGGFNAGAYFKDTDADSALYTVKGKDWGKDRLVGYVSYSF